MRGCVAHEPPSTMLCFSSKKSAIPVRTRQPVQEGTRPRNSPVYPGYSDIGSNPSHRLSGELVHSHTPPMPACPASRSPWWVTGTGCQCRSPTLAPSRSMKRSPSTPRSGGGCGDSSTPSFTRCLFVLVTGVQGQAQRVLTRSRRGLSSPASSPPPPASGSPSRRRCSEPPRASERGRPSRRRTRTARRTTRRRASRVRA